MGYKWSRAFQDWYQLYLQLLCIVVLPIVIITSYSFCDNFKMWLVNQLKPYEGQLTDFILILFVLASQLNSYIFIMTILLFSLCFLIRKIRKTNSTYILNGNSEFRRLHIHSYFEYWTAYHLMGVRKCQLTLVPIPMQFKLILQSPFSNYLYREGIQDVADDSKACVSIERIGNLLNDEDCEINLVLSDTYPIKLAEQCPQALARKTLSISRFHENFTRIHSRVFVESVLNEVRKLPTTVTAIHVYATLNPWNTYEIAKEVFKTGGRDSIEYLYVYYQSQEGVRPFTSAERVDLK